MDLKQVWSFIQSNWLLLSFAIVGGLNIAIAGARAMGWTLLADECQKIENAIQDMVQAALKKGN